MEVMRGYKKTEFGMIPEDWEMIDRAREAIDSSRALLRDLEKDGF